MLSFFDLLLTINTPHISKDMWPVNIEDLSLEEQEKFYTNRNEAYQALIQLQFQLSYHVHISIRDLDNMTRYEYRSFFNQLLKQKEEEKASIESAKS